LAVHAGSVYGPSYLLDLFLDHGLVAVHAGSVYRPSYLLDLFLVHVLVTVHASPVPRLPAGPVPDPCAAGSPCRFFLWTQLPAGAVPDPCAGAEVNAVSVHRPDYLLDLFLVHVLMAVHAGAVYEESTAGTAPECCGMGAPLCRVLAPSAAAQEVLRLLEYCLSEAEKLAETIPSLKKQCVIIDMVV
jgi:hypothetical protein